jgi:hypothetical protein
MRRAACVLVALVLLTGRAVRAGDGGWHIPHPHLEETPPAGRARTIPHTDERAGWPRCLAHHTEYTHTPGGIGYYVGGGAPLGHGDARCPSEGTWGWDETGFPHFRRRGALGWWHGRCEQGGMGAYATDGRHIPDLISGFNTRIDGLHRNSSEGDH